MRAMTPPYLGTKFDSDAGALTFLHGAAKRSDQGLNVSEHDSGGSGPCEDRGKSPSVFPIHRKTISYFAITRKIPDILPFAG